MKARAAGGRRFEKNAGGLNEAPPACAKLDGAVRARTSKSESKKLNTEILAFDFAQARMTTYVSFARMTR
jgi:hypothetical protein